MSRKDIRTLDDVKTWIAHHDGQVDAYWRQQWNFNKRIDQECREQNKLLEKLRLGQAVHNIKIVVITTALILFLTQGVPLLWQLLAKN